MCKISSNPNLFILNVKHDVTTTTTNSTKQTDSDLQRDGANPIRYILSQESVNNFVFPWQWMTLI